MGTGEFNAGGNPAMDQHPNQGRVEIFLVASCYGTSITSGLMGHLASMQTYLNILFYLSPQSLQLELERLDTVNKGYKGYM